MSTPTVAARSTSLLTLVTFVLNFFVEGPAAFVVFLVSIASAVVVLVTCLVRARHRDRAVAVIGALAGTAFAAALIDFATMPDDSAEIPLAQGFVLLLALAGLVTTVAALRHPRVTPAATLPQH